MHTLRTDKARKKSVGRSQEGKLPEMLEEQQIQSGYSRISEGRTI